MAYRSRRTGRMRMAGDGARRTTVVDVNTREFERNLRRAWKDVEDETHERVGVRAHKARNATLKYTPVDSGLLRSGWTLEERTDKNGRRYWYLYNPVGYARAVEFGTEHQRAQPMLRPGVAEAFGVQGIGVDIAPKWRTRSTRVSTRNPAPRRRTSQGGT